jgi:hypothetical protein
VVEDLHVPPYYRLPCSIPRFSLIPRFAQTCSLFHRSSSSRENVIMVSPRATVETVQYISPQTEVNTGLWTLFAGTTVFLGLRLGVKYTRRTGLWYDDYMLALSWVSNSKRVEFCIKIEVIGKITDDVLAGAYGNQHPNYLRVCDRL